MRRFGWLVPLTIVFSLTASRAFAGGVLQDAPVVGSQEPALAELSEEDLARIEKAGSAAEQRAENELTDADRAWKQAWAHLKAARAAVEGAAAFDTLIQEAPSRLERVRAELASPPDKSDPVVPPDATSAQLEPSRSQAEAALTAAQQERDTAQAEVGVRQRRRNEIPTTQEKNRDRIAAIEGDLRKPADTSAPPDLADARRQELRAERLRLLRENEQLDKELASYDARKELLAARRDLAERHLGDATRLRAFWDETLTAVRKREAEAAKAEADRLVRQAQRQDPRLKSYAEDLDDYTRRRNDSDGTVQRLARTKKLLAERKQELAELRQRFRRFDETLAFVRDSSDEGALIRKEWEAAQNPSVTVKNQRELGEQIAATNYREFLLREKQEQSRDVETELADLRQAFAADPNASWNEDLTRELLTKSREQLDLLVDELGALASTMGGLYKVQDALIKASDEYREYLGERIFGVPSVGERGRDPQAFAEAVSWLVDADAWGAAMERVGRELRERPLPFALRVVPVLLLLLIRRRLRRARAADSGLVNRYSTDAFSHTVKAALSTVVTSLPWPAVLLTIGWVLTAPSDGMPDVALAVGYGLGKAAYFLLILTFARELVRPNDLAEVHFRWPPGAVKSVRHNLRLPLWVGVPALFVYASLDGQNAQSQNQAYHDSLGRLAFVVDMLVLTVFLARVLRPSGPALNEYVHKNEDGWLDRLSLLWYGAVVAFPALLALFAVAGYYYTALELARSMLQSVLVLLLTVTVYGILLRWLFVARRRLAMEQAQRRREAAQKDQKESASELPPIEERSLNLPAINEQTLRLFRSSIAAVVLLLLYGIWNSVFPALGVLERVQIWPSVRVVDEVAWNPRYLIGKEGAEASASQTPEKRPVEPAQNGGANGHSSAVTPLPGMMPATGDSSSAQDSPVEDVLPSVITLADIGLVIVLFILLSVAARNIPALLEIAVLSRLPLDAGMRYAMTTIVRYLIVIVGAMAIFGVLGIGWSNIQWLAAALTFGLAFGLQEIFANFVSGVILLLERPIRVGDLVTVHGTDGRVLRIRMRATTIQDWDRRELIVPNKSFITNSFMNWTLSDTITRVLIKVGVAYGSDTELAKSLLLKVARESPHVLSDPAPSSMFVSFGDSTLDLELRVFIPDRDRWVEVVDRLHATIDKEFRSAGIEIAFPQRDVNLHIVDDDVRAALTRKRPDPKAASKPAPDGAEGDADE